MRILRAGLAAVALVALAAAPASADVIYEPYGECNGVVDHGCYVTDPGPKGPYSCTVWIAAAPEPCQLEHAP